MPPAAAAPSQQYNDVRENKFKAWKLNKSSVIPVAICTVILPVTWYMMFMDELVRVLLVSAPCPARRPGARPLARCRTPRHLLTRASRDLRAQPPGAHPRLCLLAAAPRHPPFPCVQNTNTKGNKRTGFNFLGSKETH